MSRHLELGKAGSVSMLHRQVSARQGVRHLRFDHPYNSRLYEMLGMPKLTQQWVAFGRSLSAKRRLDFSEDAAPRRRMTID